MFREGANVSISSKNIIEGAFRSASSNFFRKATMVAFWNDDAIWLKLTSTKYLPDSSARALAINVFPHPGGP